MTAVKSGRVFTLQDLMQRKRGVGSCYAIITRGAHPSELMGFCSEEKSLPLGSWLNNDFSHLPSTSLSLLFSGVEGGFGKGFPLMGGWGV